MLAESDELDRVSKVLKEPVYCEMDDVTVKVKNHLLLMSMISIFVVLGGLHIQQDSSILGLRFSGLNDFIVHFGLFVILAYLFFHFIWRSIDNFLEWTIRITGTRLMYVTGSSWGSDDADYPNDPRQSTLYNWWSNESSKIGYLNEKLDAISNDIKSLLEKTKAFIESEDKSNLNPNVLPQLTQFNSSITSTDKKINQLKDSIKSAGELKDSGRILVSLKRFDNAYQYFLRSQNLRWFIVDLLVPILLAIYSLILLSQQLFF